MSQAQITTGLPGFGSTLTLARDANKAVAQMPRKEAGIR